MRLLRFGLLLFPALLILNALLPGCGGGGGGGLPTPGPPGPYIVSITICVGAAAAPTPTPTPVTHPTPTPTPCPAATSTSVMQGAMIAFHAMATTNTGSMPDITTASGTLWTSSQPDILQVTQPGVFSGASEGCACITASSGGISSNPVGIAVLGVSTPSCAPCSASTDRSAAVLQWTFDAGAPIRGPIAVGPDDNLYFVSADGFMHALDARGRERFRRHADSIASATGFGGEVYAQGIDGVLRAIAPDGAELWNLSDGSAAGALAVAADGTIYAGADGALLSISSDGRRNWRAAIGEVAAIAPIPDGGVIAAVAGGRLAAFSSSGIERWTFMPDGGASGPIAIADGIAYAGSAGGYLHAIALESGAELWRIATTGTNAPIRSGPAVGDDGNIYFGSDRFYAASPDGVIVEKYDIPDAGDAAPLTLDGGGILLPGDDGLIAAVDADGSYRWGARLNGPIEAIATAAATGRNLIYIGNASGRIYAIK